MHRLLDRLQHGLLRGWLWRLQSTGLDHHRLLDRGFLHRLVGRCGLGGLPDWCRRLTTRCVRPRRHRGAPRLNSRLGGRLLHRCVGRCRLGDGLLSDRLDRDTGWRLDGRRWRWTLLGRVRHRRPDDRLLERQLLAHRRLNRSTLLSTSGLRT